jgi:nucleotide sugar dehydrogenase
MQKVCVQGLGFVGSAMATAVAIASDDYGELIYDVVGVDLPNKIGDSRVSAINQGKFPFSISDDRLLLAVSKAHKNGNLRATTDQNEYSQADIVVVDVHLDIPYLDNEPQLTFTGFVEAIKAIGQRVSPGTLIIIETTVPPGTCEKVVVPTLRTELEKRQLDPDSVHVAHSYERVMPGDSYLESIVDYWRVFAGYTEKSGNLCEEFLTNVVNVDKFPLTRLSSTIASETAKVMENTYRATNIAFIDEWTKYAETVGIDMFEVIEAIKIRPTHSNIRFPGLGVGGYCLTKDPTFTPAASKQLFNKTIDFPFSKMAVKINHEMPLHTIQRLISLLGSPLKGRRILVCGVSYREDIGDSRFSPSEILVRELIREGADVSCHDPYLTYWDELEQTLLTQLPTPADYNAVIMAVPHKQYRELTLSDWAIGTELVLDANSVFNKEQRSLARMKGIKVESIGRGDGL